PRVEELEALRPGVGDESSGKDSLRLPRQADCDAVGRMRVAEDDRQSLSLALPPEHDRVDAEDGALGSRALLPFGELPRALAGVVMGLADRHRTVPVAVSRIERLEEEIGVDVVPERGVLKRGSP